MLSQMETSQGLTLVNPSGAVIRVSRNNLAYKGVKAILARAQPVDQCWAALKALLGNPAQAMIHWFGRFGFGMVDEGSTWRIQDKQLEAACWGPLFTRSMQLSGSPRPLMQFAERINGESFNGALCLRWHDGIAQPVRAQLVPEGARPGDKVISESRAGVWALVECRDFDVVAGELTLAPGRIIRTGGVEISKAVQELVILGMQDTYRCEAGCSTGWLADMAFDNLPDAISNLTEMRSCNQEARLINRITGEVITH